MTSVLNRCDQGLKSIKCDILCKQETGNTVVLTYNHDGKSYTGTAKSLHWIRNHGWWGYNSVRITLLNVDNVWPRTQGKDIWLSSHRPHASLWKYQNHVRIGLMVLTSGPTGQFRAHYSMSTRTGTSYFCDHGRQLTQVTLMTSNIWGGGGRGTIWQATLYWHWYMLGVWRKAWDEWDLWDWFCWIIFFGLAARV